MSYRFSPRSCGAFVVAVGLAAALIVPTSASAGSPRAVTDVRLAQADTGDADSADQSQDDQTQQQPATPTSIDPCVLVTPAEASALAGASYTTGVEQTTDGGGRICVYGYQTLNVFMVVVAQAPDVSTAQADWDTEQARVQNLMQRNLPPGVTINLNLSQDAALQGYDRSATAAASGTIGPRTLNVSAIYLLKGPTFVSYSDLLLDSAAPTTDALAGESQTVLPRLP